MAGPPNGELRRPGSHVRPAGLGLLAVAYNGHKGHDSVIRSFREQAIGVPVFAALDGTVTDVHDGEFDMVVSPTGSERANYVRLDHGGTHETWYFHLRKGSVSVSVGQRVIAGTQIGLTASSGNSTAPHLHFESRYNGASYEPSAGPCRPGAGNWVQQVPIRRELYVRDFTFSPNTFAGLPGPPNDTAVRTGSVPQGTQRMYFRMETANQGPSLPWRIRVLRPGGAVSVDFSGTFANATFNRNPYWYFNVDVDLNQTGVWRLLVDIDGRTYVDAPLSVVATAAQVVNRPPSAVTVGFDPAAPLPTDVIFCRVNSSLIYEDPDYDVMSYRYQWTVNGTSVRDVTTAALSDAIPLRTAGPGAEVRCMVTPSDGTVSAPAVALTVRVESPVPVADFNGDGRSDVSLFRPSQGGWYVQGQPPVFFGLSGDIPVPGDYDGDGRTDVAVFRPSVGGWYRDGASPIFFGVSGDVPVPGDYDGDATTDVAIFRSSVGGWYVRGASPQFLGVAGDVPVPGDYDGNGRTDRAVLRPSTAGWYIAGQPPSFFGISGDVPLPLPAAVRLAAFP